MERITNVWSDNYRTGDPMRQLCCGCSVCASVCSKNAISMQYDEEGFLYPSVNETLCVECRACVRVCPVLNREEVCSEPYLETYAGYSNDAFIMKRCTSGGFATAAALKFVANGGIVCGVKYSADLLRAEYAFARTSEEVLAFSSSKYVQSEKGNTFNDVRAYLEQGEPVLFIGCPCDVYALKRFLKKEYDMLYTCELVCMGVTSYRVAEDYKKYTEKKEHSQLTSINARSKEKGWFVPHLEECFQNGKKKYSTLFGTYYGYGFQIYNRPSCLHCTFRGTHGAGDIRIGDFWGIKDMDPYWNPEGVSCLFVRNEKGEKLLSMLPQDEFSLFKTDYDTATLSNMSSYKNKGKEYEVLRDRFSEVFLKDGLIPACRKTAKLSFWVKHFLPDQWHFALKKFYHSLVDKR